jgi:predicted nucleic acid-binding protein
MFLDSNVLLFAHLDKGQSGEEANELLRMVRDGRLRAAISPLVLDEFMWGLKKVIGREQTDHAIGSIMAIPFIWLDVSFGCIRHARARFMEGLDPRDAFHAAVMDHYGLDEIVSEDIHFNKVKGIRRKTIKETIIVR